VFISTRPAPQQSHYILLSSPRTCPQKQCKVSCHFSYYYYNAL
jgi:hypothetical protein